MTDEIHEADQMNGCKVVPLAVRGWLELLTEGTTDPDVFPFHWDTPVIWIENDGDPVACVAYKFSGFDRKMFICFSYTDPVHRRKGMYRALYAKVKEIAIEKKARKIESGIAFINHGMIHAAEACGRERCFGYWSEELP